MSVPLLRSLKQRSRGAGLCGSITPVSPPGEGPHRAGGRRSPAVRGELGRCGAETLASEEGSTLPARPPRSAVRSSSCKHRSWGRQREQASDSPSAS